MNNQRKLTACFLYNLKEGDLIPFDLLFEFNEQEEMILHEYLEQQGLDMRKVRNKRFVRIKKAKP